VVSEPSTALLALPEFQNAIEEFRAINATLASQMRAYQNWLAKYNKWASLPWWKRIFTTPPGAPERPKTKENNGIS